MSASNQSHGESSAFEYLLAVDRKCIEHQGGLVQQQSDSTFSHGLAFNVGQHQYLVPITEISEVIAVSNYTALPKAPSWIQGIANMRGNLVTLLDMHHFIFATHSDAAEQTKRALLVKQENQYFGLIIDSIIGMKSFHNDSSTNKVPNGFNPDYIDHISAFYLSGEQWFASLSIVNLLQDERFKKIK